MGEDAGLLAEQRHLAAAGGHEALRAVQDPLTQDHPAALGVQQPGHDGADRGLARAVGAHEGHGAPGRDGQVDDDVARAQAEGDLQLPAALSGFAGLAVPAGLVRGGCEGVAVVGGGGLPRRPGRVRLPVLLGLLGEAPGRVASHQSGPAHVRGSDNEE